MKITITEDALKKIKESEPENSSNLIPGVVYVSSPFDESYIQESDEADISYDFVGAGCWAINWFNKDAVPQHFIKEYLGLEIVFEYSSGDPSKEEACIDFSNNDYQVIYK